MIRLLVRYEGRVQGVGFRATARQVAGDHQVSGWVKNKADGTVELVVAGDEQVVDAYLGALRARMGSKIRRETSEPFGDRDLPQSLEIRY